MSFPPLKKLYYQAQRPILTWKLNYNKNISGFYWFAKLET